ncbi:MAG: EamA family transporter [Thermodesulfobacteriota bacterium]
MMWFLLSMLTAVTVATQDAWLKKHFSAFSTYEMSAFPLVFSFPMFFTALAFVAAPPLDAAFWWSFLAGLPINALGFVLHIKAIQVSPLSLTLPYLSFTPTFMIVTGLVFLGEMPDAWGIAGILTTCAGSYVLNLDTERWSPLAPLRAVFRETGSWIMLIVAFLYSFSSVLGKLAILHSSPMFFAFLFFCVTDLLVVGAFFLLGRIRPVVFARHWRKGLIAGAVYFLHILFHNCAIALTKAAYMIAVKRTSVFFGVVFGGLLFQETRLRMRLSGTLLMFGGSLLILLKAR